MTMARGGRDVTASLQNGDDVVTNNMVNRYNPTLPRFHVQKQRRLRPLHRLQHH